MLEVVRPLLILLVFSLHSTAAYSIEDDDDHSDNTPLPPQCTLLRTYQRANEMICENEIPDFNSYNQTLMDTIVHLTIHRCPFLTLKPDSIQNLRKLQILTIDCDKVQVQGNGPAFLDLPILWALSIGKNVVAFPPAFFCQLSFNIRFLTLRHNNISSEEGFGTGNCSDGGQSLTSCHISVHLFDASHNNLTSISSNNTFFCNFKELGILNLNNNAIESIEEGALDSIPTLNELHLGGNLIKDLPVDIFKFAKFLRFLDLSNNQLSHLPVDIFKPLNVILEVLKLSGNLFKTLSSAPFASLRRLRELDLSNNRLQNVDNIYENLNLRKLDVSGNQLETIDFRTLRGLENAETLNFNRNAIRTIAENVFDNCTDLSSLDLSFNQLTSFDVHLFEGLKSLHSLNLESNRLTNSPVWDIFILSTVSSIAIGGNPWSCQCIFIIPFKHLLTYHARFIVNAQQLYCKHEPLSDDVVLLHTFNITHCDQPRSIVDHNNNIECSSAPTVAVLGVLLSVTVVVLGIFLFAFRMEIKMMVARRISKLLLKNKM